MVPVRANGTKALSRGVTGESKLKQKERPGLGFQEGAAPPLTECSQLEADAAAASGRKSCHASPHFVGQSTAVVPDQGCGQYATGHSGGAHLGQTLMSLPEGHWQRQWVNHRTQMRGDNRLVSTGGEVKVVRRMFWSPREPTSRPNV